MNDTQVYYSNFESTKTREYTYGPSMSLCLVPTDLNLYKDKKIQEKEEMQDLNNRLATYLSLSTNNAAKNTELIQELEEIKNRIKNETSLVKETYEAELGQLRNLLDDVEREKNQAKLINETNNEMWDDLETRIQSYKELENFHSAKMRDLDALLSKYSSKLSQLQQKLGFLCEEKDRDSDFILKLRTDLETAKNDLSNEILFCNDVRNRCQSLKEEIDFIKDVHELELKNLIALAEYNPVDQSKDWWNDQFASCIREIRNEYENRLEIIRNDLNSNYISKIEEIEATALQTSMSSEMNLQSSLDKYSMLENSNSELEQEMSELERQNSMLKQQNEEIGKNISDLQTQFDKMMTEKEAEMSEIRNQFDKSLVDFQAIMSDNFSLQMEIMSYKKLLESEEMRIGIQGTDKVNEEVTQDQNEQPSVPVSELTKRRSRPERKVSYQRSSKGPLTISDCKDDGSYILIDNMDQYDGQNLGGWRLVQNIDGVEEYDFTFPRYFLGPGETVKIWGEDAGPRGTNDLVWEDKKYLGIGERVVTTLLNKKGKEKSSYTQRAVYKV